MTTSKLLVHTQNK